MGERLDISINLRPLVMEIGSSPRKVAEQLYGGRISVLVFVNVVLNGKLLKH